MEKEIEEIKVNLTHDSDLTNMIVENLNYVVRWIQQKDKLKPIFRKFLNEKAIEFAKGESNEQ
jgi:hypothetical protein